MTITLIKENRQINLENIMRIIRSGTTIKNPEVKAGNNNIFEFGFFPNCGIFDSYI